MGGGPKTTTTSTVNQPQWLQNDWQNLAGQAIGQSNSAVTPQQQIASESAGITGAANGIQSFANGQLPQIQKDVTGANGTLAGLSKSTWNGDTASQYMNPYTKQVLGVQQQLANQQLGQELSGIDSSAAASGALGGSRSGIMRANVVNDANLQNQNMQANALASAYQNGQSQFNADRGTNLSSALAIGQNDATLANTAGSVFGNEANLGQMDQGAQQTALNTDYQNQLNKILFPEQQTQYASGILQSTSPNFTGSTTTQQQSGGLLQGILGAAAGIGSGIATGGFSKMGSVGKSK